MLGKTAVGLALSAMLSIPLAFFPQDPQPTLAITHVHVIPMDHEGLLADQTVLIQDEHIVNIGPADKVQVPKTATEIDGTGKYLLPGLADMHVHTTDETMLFMYLANGITTVVNMNGSPAVLALREKIRNGSVTGPVLYTTGPLLAGEGVMWRNKVVVKTPEDGRRAVTDQIQAGYDFIKIYEAFPRTTTRRLQRRPTPLEVE